jgi:DNA polymerase I-like protein with 3'-5' exonuclease and polymerase domains
MAARKKAVMPTRKELWPKPWHDFTWIGRDDKRAALRCLETVSQNVSTALDTEFPTRGNRKDEVIIWSLSGAPDQRFVLDAYWLRSKKSPFREWIADPKTKLVYFSFPSDADVIEKNARIDCERSFYADVKVEAWCRNCNNPRPTLKGEEAEYLGIRRRGYAEMFGYVPRGKSQWLVVSPDVLMEGPLPAEMLDVMSHSEWIELFKHYSACDAWGTHTLHRVNKKVLQRWGYWDTYLALDRPYTITLRHFSKRGIPIDFVELDRLDREVTTNLLRLKTCLRTIAGEPKLSLDSQSKDLRELIFTKWGWPTYDDLFTDESTRHPNGQPQLNKYAWQRYANEEGFLFARLMLPHNKLRTLKNTFINGVRLGTKYGPGAATNTLMSEYNQTGTRTGRMSSRKFDVTIRILKHYKRRPSVEVDKTVRAGMNMLNFPNKSNDPYGVRRVVCAPPPDDFAPEGYELIVGDYSGFELWLILFWCWKWGIKSKMLKHLLRGDDVHSMTAQVVCQLDCHWSEVKEKYLSERNNIGKRANFGLGYGAGWRVFCAILSNFGANTEWDARNGRVARRVQRMIDDWMELWPEMPKYQKYCVMLGYKNGFVPTIAGNRIWVADGLQSGDDGIVRHYENLCKSGPAQGSAANIVKDAQNLLERDKRMRQMGYRQMFNVYDEILGAIPKRHVEEGTARQDTIMRMPFSKERCAEVAAFTNVLPFVLRCDVHHAVNWHDGK